MWAGDVTRTVEKTLLKLEQKPSQKKEGRCGKGRKGGKKSNLRGNKLWAKRRNVSALEGTCHGPVTDGRCQIVFERARIIG